MDNYVDVLRTLSTALFWIGWLLGTIIIQLLVAICYLIYINHNLKELRKVK